MLEGRVNIQPKMLVTVLSSVQKKFSYVILPFGNLGLVKTETSFSVFGAIVYPKNLTGRNISLWVNFAFTRRNSVRHRAPVFKYEPLAFQPPAQNEPCPKPLMLLASVSKT